MSTPILAMIPSGRKATKLYSVLPTDGTGDFTVARAGLRNEINSDLKLELIAANVPAFNYDTLGGCPVLNTEPQATNLITYPISFSNSYWTKSGATIQGDPSTAGSENITNGSFTTDSDWAKGTGWTIGSGVATKSAGSTALLTQSISNYTAGKTYLLTFDITGRTAGGVGVNNSGVFAGVTYVSKSENGQYKAYYYCTTTGTGFSLYADGNFDGSVDNVSAKEVQGYSAPSVDFPTNAFKLVEDTTNAKHRVFASGVGTSNALSFYVKADGRTWVSVLSNNGGTSFFDIGNGVVGTVSAGSTGKIEELIGGWYRCTLYNSHSTFGAYVGLADANNSETYTGDGTSGVYLFMAQLETGNAATSPTFTDITLAAEGSTTTRLADVVTGGGDVNTFNSLEGVLYLEASALSNDLTFRLIAIEGTAANDFINLGYTSNSNETRARIEVGGVLSASMSAALSDETEINKIAFKYKLNDFALWVNGVEVATDILGNVFTSETLNELSLNYNSLTPFYGNTKAIQYYNTALSDSELATLTTL